MNRTRILILMGVVAALCVLLLIATWFLEDGKKAELLRAPGVQLRFPSGTLLGQTAPGTSILGAGTSQSAVYGTSTSEAEIGAFFDSELTRLGYQPLPTDAAKVLAGGERLLRHYQLGALRYYVYLRPLPYRFGSRVISSGYQHILITKLSNQKP